MVYILKQLHAKHEKKTVFKYMWRKLR